MVTPIRPSTPSGRQLRPGTAWAVLVNLCSGLGMPKIPPTPQIALEVALEMRSVQLDQNKAMELLQKQNNKLRRQINYFSGRSFAQRLVGVFIRPRYEEKTEGSEDHV